MKKNKNERFIAKMVATLLFAGALTCSGLTVYSVVDDSRNKVRLYELQKDEDTIVKAIKSTETFQKYYNEDLIKLSTGYNNGEISETEYNDELEYLNSNEYVRKLSSQITDNKTCQQLEQINKEKSSIHTSKSLNAGALIPFIGASGFTVAGSSVLYDNKQKQENTL